MPLSRNVDIRNPCQDKQKAHSVMKNKNLKMILLTLVVMALWGSIFPFIKLGYQAFHINADSIPDILMFASVRFIVSGLIVCGYSLIRREKMAVPRKRQIFNIAIAGLFSIVLHYAFMYIGISTTDSSETALIKQLGVLIYVCFAFLFFKDEKFCILKILGAIIGFAGIVAINYSPDGISFSTGDILIIMASFCTVISNVITKKTVSGSSPFWVTGISQLSGGLILLVAALCMGAKFPVFTLQSTLVFAYICTASIAGYTLWYYILKHDSLSKMFIIKSSEPLFACVFGALLLGENILKIQYLIAFILITVGILLGNKSEKKL